MTDLRMLQRVSEMEHRLSMRILFIAILAVVAIAVNGVRTYTNVMGDHRQKRIEYLDRRIEALESGLEACESGTTPPRITGVPTVTNTGYMIP